MPMLVVRAPFNQTWQRLPATLEKVGMKVTDSTRSTGSMTAPTSRCPIAHGRNWAHTIQIWPRRLQNSGR
ncbi:outer membrane protein assembly factor BamC [Enterobacter soli]